MADDQIKLAVFDTKNLRISIAGAQGVDLNQETISTSDNTEEEDMIVQPDKLQIVPSKSRLRTGNVTVHDVAAFILQQQGEMTAMKLQKLVYYSQVWSLVWDEAPLFDEPIEAWANGPVVRSLYLRHQGRFKVAEWEGDPSKLSDTQQETILKVLEFYGGMSSQSLSDLTHNEKPWQRARADLGPTDRGNRVISHASIFEYYSSL
jgi:uncharacterized phage-associated protein